MDIINFPRRPEMDLEQLPDLDAMTRDGLEAYLAALKTELARLDAREPRCLTGSAHSQWEDDHEELEDLIDEVLDRMDI